jgi:MYXO-CTERM domain-containing protein
MYCGPHGQCVVSANGAACACEQGWVAMQFPDYDSQQSVTCVPATPPVDFRADGAVLPDACATVSCGAGSCVDRNGIAVCVCADGTAAAPTLAGTTPICSPINAPTGGPGAQDYSRQLRGLAVCTPRPPVCGEGGWLTKQDYGVLYPGVDCGDSVPAHALTVEPDKPSCGIFSGCGCDTSPEGTPLAVLGAAWLVGLVILRRRRA